MSRMTRKMLALCLLSAVVAAGAWAGGGTEGAGAASAAPVQLQVFSMPANKSGLMEGWWADVLKKEVGITIELLPSGDQGQQKLQALMASGELPDIVVFKDKKEVEDAVRGKMLLNLDDYAAKLPNVFKNAGKALQFYRDAASAGAGKAYSIPNGVGPGEVGDEINWGPFLRWDLYKKLGMPAVNTLEDYLPLIKKMMDLEPKNEDGQKVYGMTMWKDWDWVTLMLASQPSVIAGIDSGDQLGGSLPYFEVDFNTGKISNNLDADSYYLRALKFYFKANQMGLIDPDSLTQRWDAAFSKMQQGRVLFAWWPWFGGAYNTPERANVTPPKGFRPVLTKDYKAFWWGDNPVGGSWSWAIGAATKNREACLRYVDYMYSMEGLMTLLNGPKGVTWDVNSKGEPFVTDQGWDIIDNNKDLPSGGKIGDGTAVVNSYGLSGMTVNPKYSTPLGWGYWPSSMGHKPTVLLKDWQDTTGFKSTSAMLKAKNMFTITPLSMRLTPAMPDEIKNLAVQVGDVVRTNSWLMVFAADEAKFNALYKEMVDKANGLGIAKILDWDKKAWEEAKATAAKYAR